MALCAQGPVSSLQGTKHHFTPGGRLVANKQIVYTIVEETGLQPVSSSGRSGNIKGG